MQTDTRAARRPGVMIEQIGAFDLELQRNGEERRRQLLDVERQHARETTCD